MKFLRIFRQIVWSNWHLFLAYRTDALASVFSSMAWAAFSVFAVLLVTAKTGAVAGWLPSELLLMTATYGIIVGWFHILFSHSFMRFAQIVGKGELDAYLLKPTSVAALLSIQTVRFPGLVRMGSSIGLAWWIIAHYQLHTTMLSIVGFCILGLFGIALLYGLHLLSLTILIHVPTATNVLELVSVMMGTARQPVDIAKKAPFALGLVFVPVLLSVSIPTKVLIIKASVMDVVTFCLVSLTILLVAIIAWGRALRSYVGAGV